MCVHHSTLDVIQVSVVLQSPLQQSSLLTELSDVCTIVVCEHLVAQDSICNLQQNMKQCILQIPQKCNAVVLFYFPIGFRVLLFCCFCIFKRCVHLWSVHEVHLQQAGLQWSFWWSVILESIQEEGGALLDQVVLHKNIHDLDKYMMFRKLLMKGKKVMFARKAKNIILEKKQTNHKNIFHILFIILLPCNMYIYPNFKTLSTFSLYFSISETRGKKTTRL